jgi:hypothetical protein
MELQVGTRVGLSVSNLGESGEGFLHAELILGVLVGETVELSLVRFEVLDKVDKMARLLELVEVLSIDQVAKLILNANHKLNSVERVKTVVSEKRVHGDRCLFGGTEIVAHNRKNIGFDLVLAGKHKGVGLRVNLLLPEGHGSGGLALVHTHLDRVGVETNIGEVGAGSNGTEDSVVAES